MLKVLSVKGWMILMAITLVFSFSLFQQYQLIKTRGDVQSLTTELDYYVDENVRMSKYSEMQEEARGAEMEAINRQLSALSKLREEEEALLNHLQQTKETNKDVEEFFSTPLPTELYSPIRVRPQ